MSGGTRNTAHEILKAEIRLAIGAREGIALFLNDNGKARRLYTPEVFTYGLGNGTSDLVAIVSRQNVVIAVDREKGSMTIGPLGIFLAIEVKTGNGKPTKEQATFLRMVREMGGVSGVARSVADAIALYDKARRHR